MMSPEPANADIPEPKTTTAASATPARVLLDHGRSATGLRSLHDWIQVRSTTEPQLSPRPRGQE